MLQILEPGIFSDCTNLRNLSLSANNIPEISRAVFYGLAHLEHLDLSNNNIEDFNPLVFEIFSISSFDPKLELLSLNVSSNRLDSLDDASVMWLNHTAAVTDLSGNPWKCECSALGEAWRGLRHKLTLNCASPEDRRGRTWNETEDLCPSGHIFAKLSRTDNPNLKTSIMNWSSTAEPENAEEFPDSDNTTKNSLFLNERNETSSLMTAILIVIGVLSGCVLVAGCIILVVLVKKLRDSSNALQDTNVYTPVILDRQVPTESLNELNSECDYATEHIYETVT
jgi:Leucine-rich repeat (LRR) protein